MSEQPETVVSLIDAFLALHAHVNVVFIRFKHQEAP
jgi:hypothetical protein